MVAWFPTTRLEHEGGREHRECCDNRRGVATAPPFLVVEIRSPSTALFDLNGPELTVFKLRDGRYFLAAKSTQPLTVAHPFEVTIVPANLTRGLPR
jgi:hypothetical protein